jgi:hypothetical protein
MKKEISEDPKNPENPPVPAALVKPKPRKEQQEKKKKEKKQPQADDIQLPVLVELTYSVSVCLLIFVGLAVIIVSLLTGASLLDLVLRTSAAMLAVGCLLVVIFYQVSSGTLQASLAEQEEAQKKAEEAETPESSANFEIHEVVEA